MPHLLQLEHPCTPLPGPSMPEIVVLAQALPGQPTDRQQIDLFARLYGPATRVAHKLTRLGYGTDIIGGTKAR